MQLTESHGVWEMRFNKKERNELPGGQWRKISRWKTSWTWNVVYAWVTLRENKLSPKNKQIKSCSETIHSDP